MPEVLDVTLTLIQSILFQYTVSCCSEEREIKNDLIIIMSSFIVNYWLVKLTEYLSVLSILNILWHFLLMSIVYYVYKNDKKIRIVNCSIFYIFNCSMIIIVSNVLNLFMNLIDYEGNKILLIMKLYFILYIFLSVVYILKIKNICDFFIQNEKVNSIVTCSFIIEFILAVSNGNFFKESSFTIDLSLLIGQMFIVITSCYFFILYIKSKRVFQANKSLEIKNLELKNIKESIDDIYKLLKSQKYENKGE